MENQALSRSNVGLEVEVLPKAKRRRFTLEYKRRILREADRCSKPGELGALLRREGLYSSSLSTWRAARDRGELGGEGTRKRGPVAKPPDPGAKRIAELERENRQLRQRAERAEALVEVQKKLSELLGLDLPENGGRS
jgi:transposase-like protein